MGWSIRVYVCAVFVAHVLCVCVIVCRVCGVFVYVGNVKWILV